MNPSVGYWYSSTQILVCGPARAGRTTSHREKLLAFNDGIFRQNGHNFVGIVDII
jgi:hypothetical protein